MLAPILNKYFFGYFPFNVGSDIPKKDPWRCCRFPNRNFHPTFNFNIPFNAYFDTLKLM